MQQSKTRKILLLILVTIFLGGCNLPALTPVPNSGQDQKIDISSLSTPLPPPPETLISFQVQIPDDTPEGNQILLTILDDVTNFVLNTELYPMSASESIDESGEVSSPPIYTLTIPASIGSTIKYRYEREFNNTRIVEHLSDNNPVHYRLLQVSGQTTVRDIISSWADSEFDSPTGYIQGRVLDEESGKGVPSVLVSAGGMQSLTNSEGVFKLEGLPAGVHNLVAYAMDGTYNTFQQGALVEVGNITPVEIHLEMRETVSIVFVVKVPEDTPPIVPLRMAGNLHQLGNSYAQLNGGMSGIVENMPVLNILPDGRYTIILELPIGADIRYKYTLGDGLWNAEHDEDGRFVIRQLIVPGQNTLVEEEVETWQDSFENSLTFDVYVPGETPPEDTISIQFSPMLGWTEPIPMWKLEDDRWAYILFSPLNLPGEFHYRYCRNGQCGKADDIQTPGLYGRGRPLTISHEQLTVQDSVSMWIDWGGIQEPSQVGVLVDQRPNDFWAGVEIVGDYHPSWMAYMSSAFQDVQSMNANWVILSPSWSYPSTIASGYYPSLKDIPGQDAIWFEALEIIRLAQDRNLKVGLFPKVNLPLDSESWWIGAEKSSEWWLHWFENYSNFIINYADLAEQTGASALIIGGEWVRPASPVGILPDGSSSGVPDDSEERWRRLFAEIRSRFRGRLIWAMPYEHIHEEDPFLDDVDMVYVLVNKEDLIDSTSGTMVNYDRFFEYQLLPFHILSGKSIILALDYPSEPDMVSQSNIYNNFLEAAMSRNWIHGFVSRGYYPPVSVQDNSSSVNGKPASDLLSQWFYQLLGIQ